MGWTPMQGQSWLEAGAVFVALWTAMMVAMMLPSLVPMLGRNRRAVSDRVGAAGAGGTGGARLVRLTGLVGLAYFLVWASLGAVVFPLGAAVASALAGLLALARAAPLAVGAVVLLAGGLQLTRWKARQLACCREMPGPGRTLAADAGTAWRHGASLGLRCVRCCAAQTAVMLALGVMDLRVMAVVTAAITAERLAPGGERVARATGAVALVTGLLLIARALPLW
jgi:predicted metal-binding membrane protein